MPVVPSNSLEVKAWARMIKRVFRRGQVSYSCSNHTPKILKTDKDILNGHEGGIRLVDYVCMNKGPKERRKELSEKKVASLQRLKPTAPCARGLTQGLISVIVPGR
ncbi:Uncharacterized protein HZ326_22734 [Fusarium oxysporum f. sp. albedinis]|nr:Uncharacterized protein HZ326_22734 [Fusarium oxysporum f. sp. albedinis]